MTRDLTYFAPRKCYKKKRNGQTFYIGKGSEADTDANYRRAFGEWEEKLTELVTTEKAARQTAGLPVIIQAIRNGTPTTEQHEAAGFPLPEHVAAILNASANTNEQLRQLLDASGMLPKPQQEAVRTVDEVFTMFIDAKRQQARTDQRSAGRFANVESYGKLFRDFVGAEKPVTAMDGVALANFYSQQLELMEAEEISQYAARDRLQVARQFIRKAYELGLIDLPRNVDSKELVIACSPGKVKPMPIPALLARVKAATGRLKCELLLMANCGFNQVDCAELTHSELNLAKGTITRRRSKTSNHKGENIPTVTWTLWASTIELLRRNGTTDRPHVLATRNGHKTVRSEINDEGKAKRIDAVAQAYDELQDTMKGTRYPLKSIRKCAASALGNSKEFSRYAQYFLGDSPRTVADAHYVQPSESEFAKACEWLGTELGLTTLEDVGEPSEA